MDKKILVFVLLLIQIVYPIVSADRGPMGNEIEIDVGEIELEEGNWYISFIGIEKDEDIEKAMLFLNQRKEEYINLKKKCGLTSSFNIGTKDGGTSIESAKSDCDDMESYVWGWTPPEEIEHYSTYSMWTIDFDNYMFVYNSKHDDPNEYSFSYYRQKCKLVNNKCSYSIGSFEDGDFQELYYRPYIVVLEKVDSENEIYFSDVVYINWEQNGRFNWSYDETNNYYLKPNVFEISENKLVVDFGAKQDPTPVLPASETPRNLYYIVGGIILIFILLLIYFNRKKK